MSQAAVCVVVPVYNAAATLDRCVQSVVSQQVTGGLQCVLVNDGSPDNSGALCDAWAARDSRVQVLHQGDLGVSMARNNGMALADSEFLVFLDSDDALRPGALQAALDAQRTERGKIKAGARDQRRFHGIGIADKEDAALWHALAQLGGDGQRGIDVSGGTAAGEQDFHKNATPFPLSFGGRPTE